MQYYLISFIISIILFIIIQYLEYNKTNNEYINNDDDYREPYSLYTINNCLLFLIIYIVATIVAYYLYSANIDLSFLSQKTVKEAIKQDMMSGGDNDNINPQVLSKITDQFDVSLEPFNSDSESDMSSISSKDGL
jgi:hypothetical protein